MKLLSRKEDSAQCLFSEVKGIVSRKDQACAGRSPSCRARPPPLILQPRASLTAIASGGSRRIGVPAVVETAKGRGRTPVTLPIRPVLVSSSYGIGARSCANRAGRGVV